MTASGNTVLDAFLTLVAERGYGEVTLRDVAAAADLGLADLYRLYPDKTALVAGMMARVDATVLAGTPREIDPEETARDRLFDVMMRRYDALKPHREAIRSIVRAARRDPLLALALAPSMRRSMAAMLEAAGLSSEGISGAVRQNGLLAIHTAVSRVFLGDDSADLSKTMAALDGRLKTAERWIQVFEKSRISRAPSASEPSTG
ncbi:MAG: TetR family transcriptional regulator [Proteobacteria bacterium]|nr:TetR family transcriptional regulator [Pseudomonadota bacterium]